MPRGGARAGAGRKRTVTPLGEKYKRPSRAKVKPKKDQDGIGDALAGEVFKGYTGPSGKKVAEAPPEWPFGTSEGKADLPPEIPEEGIDPATGKKIDPDLDPLEFLKRVVRNPKIDVRTRAMAANQAAPYLYPKKDGKKEKDAPKAPSKFGTSKAPLSVVGGSKA